MCTKLDKIQQRLDPAYHGLVHLRKNIIWACRGHPALANGLTNSLPDASSLVNMLYTSIVNYKTIDSFFSASVQQSYIQLHRENQADAYFTDHQYQKSRFNSQPSWLYNTQRLPKQCQKKCFVCSKKGCWSTNHLQQERNNFKKQFTDQHSDYKSHKRYDCRLQQYISEYKGVDSNKDNTAQFFKKLSIDAAPTLASASNTQPAESFFTVFGEIHSAESMATIGLLANKVFKHQITSENKTIALASAKPEPYSFNTSSNTQYNDLEFKSLLIDSGAAICSTGGIG